MTGEPLSQVEIDRANSGFWDELCGTQLARSLGVTDSSRRSLERFDRWYFQFYPYLHKYVPFPALAGCRTLEIGLGYGTVGQRIAESGAEYVGLDIAPGPVAMILRRLRLGGLRGAAVRGSALACPFPDESFDWVIAIGSLHHTGNLPLALREVHRVLRPRGRALVMVYNALSYRQWALEPMATLRRGTAWSTEPPAPADSSAMRRLYDANAEGSAAPETVFVTKTQLRFLCRAFASVRVQRENIGADGPLRHLPRSLLNGVAGPFVGLDLYCQLRK